jgi:hypothetical protein
MCPCEEGTRIVSVVHHGHKVDEQQSDLGQR